MTSNNLQLTNCLDFYLMLNSFQQHIVHHALLLGQDQVEEDSQHSRDDEGRLDDELDPIQETLEGNVRALIIDDLIEPGRCHNVDETEAQCDDQNEAIASSELDHSKNTNTRHCDRAEEENLHATEDRRRHGGEDSAEFRDNTHEHQETCGCPTCAARLE